MTLLELIKAQEEARMNYQLNSDYLEQMRQVRMELVDAKTEINNLNKILTYVKDYCKAKEFSLEEIFGVPKKQIHEMDALELQELNNAITERQRGKVCYTSPYELSGRRKPIPTPDEQAKSLLEASKQNFGIGIEEIAKVTELRKKYEHDLDALLKDIKDKAPDWFS
jgi:hypothetical protein